MGHNLTSGMYVANVHTSEGVELRRTKYGEGYQRLRIYTADKLLMQHEMEIARLKKEIEDEKLKTRTVGDYVDALKTQIEMLQKQVDELKAKQ
jgi:hypothetical protein